MRTSVYNKNLEKACYKMEQGEHTTKEINYAEFVDNQDILDLIGKVWTLSGISNFRSTRL